MTGATASDMRIGTAATAQDAPCVHTRAMLHHAPRARPSRTGVAHRTLAPTVRHGGPSAAPARSTQASARAVALVVGALAWLLVGCCGLLWTIAFTSDARSMAIGLAVWVFCFVAPSTLATALAYRLEEQQPTPPREREPARRSVLSASAGD